ncbi:MAG: hypothetical protein ACOCYZ_01110 [Halococcoides sp.]
MHAPEGQSGTAPEEIFDEESLGDDHWLVLQAPGMAIVDTLDRLLGDQSEPAICRDLDSATTVEDGRPVLVPEFYRAVLAAEDPGAIESLLDRRGGLIVLARPRTIDWLVGSADWPVTTDDIEQFDRVRSLQYDPDDDRTAATTAARLDSPVDTIAGNLDSMTYDGYRFESDIEQSYPATVVPGWASVSGLESRAAESVREQIQTAASHGDRDALRRVLDDTDTTVGETPLSPAVRTAMAEIVTSEAISGPAITGPPASVGGAIVWGLLGDGGAGVLWATLRAMAMSPGTKEAIESELSLPPDTIDVVIELLDPAGLTAVRETFERHPDHTAQIETLQSRREEVESLAGAFRTAVHAIQREATGGASAIAADTTRPDRDADPTSATASALAGALGPMLGDGIDRADWEWAICSVAAERLDGETAAAFSDCFHREIHDIYAESGALPTVIPRWIETLLHRAIDGRLLATESDRVALVARNLALGVAGFWAFGDEALQSEPADATAIRPGDHAADAPAFVRAVLAETDARLAARDWPDWIETRADAPLDPLRDRVLGRGVGAALASLSAGEARSFARALAFDHDDTTEPLYRAGLRAVLDGEATTARRSFRACWARRDDDASHRRAIAAGVFDAAHLELLADRDRSADEITPAVRDADVELPAPVAGLRAVVDDREATVELDAVETDDQDPPFEALEAMACERVIDRLRNPPTIEDWYETALYAAAENDPERAIQAFRTVWASSDDASAEGARDAAAAGVALLAHADLGLIDAVDASAVMTAVEAHRDQLTAAVEATADAIEGATDLPDSDEIRPAIGTDDLDRTDLERVVFAGLFETVQNGVGTGDDTATTDDVSDLYERALAAVTDDDLERAVQALGITWEAFDETSGETARDAAAAGVALQAHADLGYIDPDTVDTDAVMTAVEAHRDDLDPAILATVDAIDGAADLPDGDELRADSDGDGIDRTDLVRTVFATFAEQIAATRSERERASGRDDEERTRAGGGRNDRDMSAPEPTDFEATELFEAALIAVTEDDLERAIQAFGAAWQAFDDASGDNARDATAAGVALLAHVELGLIDGGPLETSAVRAAVETHRDALDPSVRTTLDAIDGVADLSIDDHRPEVDGDDIDRDYLVKSVFSTFAEQVRADDGTSSTESTPVDPDALGSAVEAPLLDGLDAIAAEAPRRAVPDLLDAWDARPEAVDTRSGRYAAIAGVALLAITQSESGPRYDDIAAEIRSDLPGEAVPDAVRPIRAAIEGESIDPATVRERCATLPVHADRVGTAMASLADRLD